MNLLAQPGMLDAYYAQIGNSFTRGILICAAVVAVLAIIKITYTHIKNR